MLKGRMTYLGAGMLLLNGLFGLLACVVPDLGDGPCDSAGSIEKVNLAMIGFGLRRAL